MGLFDKLKLVFQLKRAGNAVAEANKSGFSWGVAFTKMAKNFAFTAGGLLVVHFSDPANIAALLGVLPENLEKVLVAFAVPVAIFIKNWWANRKNEIVMMVPVEAQMADDRRKTPTPLTGAVPIPISMKPAVPPATEPTVPAPDAGA